MARTVNTIYNAILADKANYAELSDLSATSQTGIWRLWAYITALAIHLHERIFDAFKVEVNELIAVSKVHTGRWYQAVSLLFQYDVNTPQTLIVNESFVPQYASVDPTKRIVTRATIREASRKIYIKINKGSVPNLQVLSASEMSAFVSYINQMKDAGTQVIVQSFPSEKLIAKLEVDYAPRVGIVLDTQVKDMIDDYLSSLDWDGTINVQALEARILSDPRVKNIKVVYLLATQSDDKPIQEIYNLPQGLNLKVYQTVAGHIILNRDLTEITLNAV